MLRQAISCEWLSQRAIWELKHVQYNADIVRWAEITKYVIYRKRSAFDSAHAYTLKTINVNISELIQVRHDVLL